MLAAKNTAHRCLVIRRTKATWGSGKLRLERLEGRLLLSSTLYVTPAVTPDATHFQTLQAALEAAVAGDTVLLQSGFSAGTFASTHLTVNASAGTMSIRTADPLSTGEVISIGTTTLADPLERALVTGVSATGTGDYLITLATALLYNHSGSAVDANNPSSIGRTIGLSKALTLTADAGVVLPFNLEIWKGTTGATLSNLVLSGGAGTSVFVDGDGNTLSGLTVSNQILLSNAHNNMLSGLSAGNRLFVDIGSSGNTINGSNLHQVILQPGSHGNLFTGNTIGSLRATGNTSSSGADVFQNNLFTGPVKVTGNIGAATNDVFSGNTFAVTTGDALTLLTADGTLVKDNTFTVSKDYANAVVVGNSRNVVLEGNHVSGTGLGNSGIYAYSELAYNTSVDLRDNVLSTGSGFGLYLAKWDATAGFEARVQGNDLRNNAIGVIVYGDGTSAGNVDIGGGTTAFGNSTGGNDFSSFSAADDLHYAIGLAGTDGAFTVLAKNNKWSVSDPMTAVADGSHDLAAGGSGVIVATAAAPVETLALTANALSVVQTGSTSGVVAHFSSNLPHVAGDFSVLVSWGDGATSAGTVVANAGGGFDVIATHAWNLPGTFTMTVSLSSSGGAAVEAGAGVTVTPRVLAASGVTLDADKGATFSSTVATFTDNLAGTSASSYIVSITWSDGVVTTGTVVKNADGSFSVNTTRSFSQMGTLTATVSIQTTDGLFSTSADLTVMVTTKSGKLPPGKLK